MSIVPSITPALTDISVWESKTTIVLIGKSQITPNTYRIFEIERPSRYFYHASTHTRNENGNDGDVNRRVQFRHHDKEYSSQEISRYLRSQSSASVNDALVCTAENIKFIVGLIHCFESSYFVLADEIEVVASIHGHLIYKIVHAYATISLVYKPRDTMEESRVCDVLHSIDFTAGYYFSYTYPLANTLQDNIRQNRMFSTDNRRKSNDDNSEIHTSKATGTQGMNGLVLNDMFVWNFFALNSFMSMVPSKYQQWWIVPIIHGYVGQQQIVVVPTSLPTKREDDSRKLKQSVDRVGSGSDNGDIAAGCTLTLIARRSRHFAGVRYLRRGADTEGSVANEVESEQIVVVMGDSVRSSSLVQLRGSIPLFWSHSNVVAPSPGILIEPDLPTYGRARLSFLRHMLNLQCRYGKNISVLNMVSQGAGSREFMLGNAFEWLCSQPPHEILKLVYEAELKGQQAQEKEKSLDTAQSVLFKLTGILDPRSYLPETLGGLKSTGTSTSAVDALRPVPPPAFVARDGTQSAERTHDAKLHHIFTGEDDSDGQELDVWNVSTIDQLDTLEAATDEYSFDGNPIYVQALPRAQEMVIRYIGYDFHQRSSHFPIERSRQQGDDSPSVHNDDEDEVDLVQLSSSPRTGDSSPGDVFNELSEICQSEIIRSGFFIQRLPDHNICIDNQEAFFKASDDTMVNKDDVLQNGVLRTNCIDCLDRTNIGQFCYAKIALLKQISALGVAAVSEAAVLTACMELWSEHGDILARQYAGSGAMHRVDKRPSGQNGYIFSASQKMTPNDGPIAPSFMVTSGVQNAIVAVQRYTSNISSDFDRQHAIDLFLGVYQPLRRKDNSFFGATFALWDGDQMPNITRYERARMLKDSRVSSAQDSEYSREMHRTAEDNAYLGFNQKLALSLEVGDMSIAQIQSPRRGSAVSTGAPLVSTPPSFNRLKSQGSGASVTTPLVSGMQMIWSAITPNASPPETTPTTVRPFEAKSTSINVSPFQLSAEQDKPSAFDWSFGLLGNSK